MGFVWPDITRPYTPPPEEPAGSSLRHNLIWIQCGFVEKGVKNELEVNLQQVVKRIKASKRAAVWTTCGATEQYDVYVVTEYDRSYRDERMKRCNNAKNVNMAASSRGVKNGHGHE